jgi:5-methylcytosine-specific restriction endonuclease McrA
MLFIKPNIDKAIDHYNKYEKSLKSRINAETQFLIAVNKQNSSLYRFLFDLINIDDNNKGSLYDLITALPDRMEEIINDSDLDFITNRRNDDNDNKELKKIFSICYSSDLDKTDHIQSVKTHTCPYCNHTFIQTDKQGRGKHEIDHFYPQATFPYFAMSYFNLIPACRSCNAEFGGKKNTLPIKNKRYPFEHRIYNPYDERVKGLKFNLDLKDIKDIWKNNLNIKVTPKSMGEGYQMLFKIESIYSHHTDYVHELYLKHIYLYSDIHQEQLLNWINGNKKSINIDLYRYLYGFYEEVESYHKRPLSKMAGDILSEIDDLLKRH